MLTRIPRWIRQAAPLVLLWAAVTTYYVFVISAGHFAKWHVWSAFYDAQAEALLQGHLHLLEAPSRALMSLKNPYDIANMPYWRWDHSYYQGHLYLYWGMVPAFMAAAVKLLFRVRAVADNALTFAFFLIRLVAGTLLIRDVARNAVPRPPAWAVALGMLVFALANPTPYTLARSGIYEAAIMGGVAFSMAGLYLGVRSMAARSNAAAAAWLAAASLSFGLGAGSRLNLFPTVVALVALAGFWRWWQQPDRGKGRLVLLAVASLLPAGAVMMGLLAINYLRFGDWFEFGRSYVMTYPYFLPRARFLLPNSYAYAFAPPQVDCSFPFLSSPWNTLRTAAPDWLPIPWAPDHHSSEPTIGLLAAAPFAWLAVIAALTALERVRVRRFVSSSGDTTSTLIPRITLASASRWMTRTNWLRVALLVYLAGAAPFMILNVTTMRYEHDFASGILLLAIFGGWRLLAAPPTPIGRRAIAWVYGVLAVSTIAAGVLLGFGGYFKHFERHNPALMHALQAALSLCRRG